MSDNASALATALQQIDKSDWPTYKFGDIAFNISERVEPQATDLKTYVGLEHLDSGDIHIRRKGTPADVKGTKLKVYKGDIIFGKRRAYQRKAAIADFDGICSAHAMVIRANPKNIDPDFFPFFLHSDAFMHRAVEISEGSLSPTIKWKILKKQEFKLPPPLLQQSIVELLLGIDTNYEKLLITSSRQETFKLSFIENNFLTNDGQKISFKDLGEIVRGVGYKPEDLGEETSDKHLPVLRANGIQNSRIEFNDLKYVFSDRIKPNQLLKTNDIVICMSNGSKELVGKVGLFQSYKSPISFGSFCSCFRGSSDKNAKIAYYLFQSKSYRRKVGHLISGSNINNLKPSDIENMIFTTHDERQLELALKQLVAIEENAKEISNRLDITKSLKTAIISTIFA